VLLITIRDSLIFGVEYSDYFGEHGTIENVELGDKNNVIVGKINRTANNNGTPRIVMGTQYKEWVQQAFKQWEFMNVKIINPNLCIFIRKKEKVTFKPPTGYLLSDIFYTYTSN
jgi:hypothetical protein